MYLVGKTTEERRVEAHKKLAKKYCVRIACESGFACQGANSLTEIPGGLILLDKFGQKSIYPSYDDMLLAMESWLILDHIQHRANAMDWSDIVEFLYYQVKKTPVPGIDPIQIDDQDGWTAHINVNGQRVELGQFLSLMDAIEARLKFVWVQEEKPDILSAV